jgi:uncharacterized membrane protein
MAIAQEKTLTFYVEALYLDILCLADSGEVINCKGEWKTMAGTLMGMLACRLFVVAALLATVAAAAAIGATTLLG